MKIEHWIGYSQRLFKPHVDVPMFDIQYTVIARTLIYTGQYCFSAMSKYWQKGFG